MTAKPVFIVVEGADGSGKSTVAKLLAKKLNAVFLETPDEKLRAVRKEIDDFYKGRALASHLFYASAVAYASERARELLEGGESVVVVRYWASTAAYDGVVRDSGMDDSAWIGKILPPHFTCFLQVSAEVRRKRMGVRGETNETDEQSLKDHELLESRYLKVLSEHGKHAGRVLPVFNDATPEDCAACILQEMREHSGRA